MDKCFLIGSQVGGCYNFEFLTFCEISFAHNLYLSGPIILKFYTEHGSDTAVLCVKFRNDRAIEVDVRDKKKISQDLSLKWVSVHKILPGYQKCWLATRQTK